MKRVVSVSIGSSRRNHVAEVKVLGEEFRIERIGTDGDLDRAAALIRELDGQVAALGLGGIDLYLWAGSRRYTFRDARRLAAQARRTPVVDGSGLKQSLERRVVRQLADDPRVALRGKRVLMVSAVDRVGMAEAFDRIGCPLVFGDILFALGLPIPIRSLKALNAAARVVLPVLTQLPFRWVYPTGSKQEINTPRFTRYFDEAQVIAGDFLYISRYMPPRLDGKVILTNTVTAADEQRLRERGVAWLVTTTPELEGRSFGTNVIEALLIAISGRHPGELTGDDYLRLLDQIGFQPRVQALQTGQVSVHSTSNLLLAAQEG
ncbi:MAG: quinate 5-dehydrogenase [Limnochordaceae bacterium]|nr:quinate 5-dehydrogenase [Limnochordaceae bacterium]